MTAAATKGKRGQKVISLNSKVYPVQLDLIRIPVDVDAQRQFRPRWGTQLAQSLDLDKIGTPVLNFRAGIYWCIDGQHRIYAMIENGFGPDKLECRVHTDLTDEQMADLFYQLNNTKAVSKFEKFKSAVKAGYATESAIIRVVESSGCKVSPASDEGCIAAVASLERVYKFGGESVLGKAVRTARDAFDGAAAGFSGKIIEGLGLVFNRYDGAVDERQLASKVALARGGAPGLLRKAEAWRQSTGNHLSSCVAAAIVDLYNKGRGPRAGGRLSPWFKQQRVQ